MSENKRWILLPLIFLFVLGCVSPPVYDTTQDLPIEGWHKDSTILFTTEIKDTTSHFRLLINVRHHHNYPFRNMWLFIATKGPSGVCRTDTFECMLADPLGRWYGSGWGDLYSVRIPFRNHVQFSSAGLYEFNIQHGMRKDTLMRISSVGLRIEDESLE